MNTNLKKKWFNCKRIFGYLDVLINLSSSLFLPASDKRPLDILLFYIIKQPGIINRTGYD
jgi:hypothetical protein